MFISFPKEKGSQISRATGNTRRIGSLGSVSEAGEAHSHGENFKTLGLLQFKFSHHGLPFEINNHPPPSPWQCYKTEEVRFGRRR